MHTLTDDVARANMARYREEPERDRLAQRVARAQRLQRRADRAKARAHHANLLAVLR